MIIEEKTTYRPGNGRRKRDNPENSGKNSANYIGK